MGRYLPYRGRQTHKPTWSIAGGPAFSITVHVVLLSWIAMVGCDDGVRSSSSDGGLGARQAFAVRPVSFGTRLLLPSTYLLFNHNQLYGWEICQRSPDDGGLTRLAMCMRGDAVAETALIEGEEVSCRRVDSAEGGDWAYDDLRPLRADEGVTYVTAPIWGLDLAQARALVQSRLGPCQTPDDEHLQHTGELSQPRVFRSFHVRSTDNSMVGTDPVKDESVHLDLNPREETQQYVALRLHRESEADAEPLDMTQRWRHELRLWREPPLAARTDLPHTRDPLGRIWALYPVNLEDPSDRPWLRLADGTYRIEARAAQWSGPGGDATAQGEVAPEAVMVSARYEEIRFEMSSALCHPEGDALRAERLGFEVQLPTTWETPWVQLRWRDPGRLDFFCLGRAADTLALSISREIIVAGRVGVPTQLVDPTADGPDSPPEEMELRDRALDFTHGHTVRYTAVLSYLDADEHRQALTLAPIEHPLPIVFPELRGVVVPIPGAEACMRDGEHDNEFVCQSAPQVTALWLLPETGAGVSPTLPPVGVWQLPEDLSVRECGELAVESACAGRSGCAEGPMHPPSWQPEALGSADELARSETAFRHNVRLSQNHSLCLGIAPDVNVEMSPTTLRAATSTMVIHFSLSDRLTHDTSDPLQAFLNTPDACGVMRQLTDGDRLVSRRVRGEFSANPQGPPTEVMVAYGREESGCSPEQLVEIVAEMCADATAEPELPAACRANAVFFPGGDLPPARYPLTARSDHDVRRHDTELVFVGSAPRRLRLSAFFCQKYAESGEDFEEDADIPPALIQVRRDEVRDLETTFETPSDLEEMGYVVHDGVEPGGPDRLNPREQPAKTLNGDEHITFEATAERCGSQPWIQPQMELRFFRIPDPGEAYEGDVPIDHRSSLDRTDGEGARALLGDRRVAWVDGESGSSPRVEWAGPFPAIHDSGAHRRWGALRASLARRDTGYVAADSTLPIGRSASARREGCGVSGSDPRGVWRGGPDVLWHPRDGSSMAL